MKLKFYLRGLGVGVLVTTLILTVANTVRDNQPLTNNNTSTVASALRSSMPETKAVDSEQTTGQATQQNMESTVLANSEAVTEEASVQIATEPVTEATIVQKQEVVSQPITVVLSNVLNSQKAAQAIANAGVIDDWTDFNKYLESSGYAVKIHNGTYNLYKGQDYESIAKIITGK